MGVCALGLVGGTSVPTLGLRSHRWAGWDDGKASSEELHLAEPWRMRRSLAGEKRRQGKVSRAKGTVAPMQRGLGSFREQGVTPVMGTWSGGERRGNHAPTLIGMGGPKQESVKTVCHAQVCDSFLS